MKKHLLALAAVAVTGSALAENNVVLYGVADAWIGQTSGYVFESYNPTTGSYTTRQSKQMVVDSGGLSGSRVGLRVTEELGNGMQGYVNLEAGGRIDKGNGIFARKAVLGLRTDWGNLSFGRQMSAYDDAFARVSAQGDSGFDSAKGGPLTLDSMQWLGAVSVAPTNPTAQAGAIAAANTVAYDTGAWVGYRSRFDNSIRYESPNLNGFSGSVVFGLGENKRQSGKATLDTALHLRYHQGPLMLSFAHQTEQSAPVANPFVTLTPPNGVLKLQNTLVGGAYDFGAVRLHAGFNVAKYNLKDFKAQKEVLLGIVVPMGQLTMVAQYAKSKGDTLRNTDSFGVEAHYALSKRTTGYVGLNSTKLPDYKNSKVGGGVRHIF